MVARTSGKSRLFIGFTAILLLFIFALFHSSQQQVDELRVAGIKCEQHEMALQAQYDNQGEKIRQLERSLEHSRSALKAEKELREKAVQDANLRFSSLQQHYKTLQREHGQLKAQLDENKKEQFEDVDKWKSKYAELETRFNKLQTTLDGKETEVETVHLLQSKNQQLTNELEELRSHCNYRASSSSVNPPMPSSSRAAQDEILPKPLNNENVLREPALAEKGPSALKTSTATLNKASADRSLQNALPIAAEPPALVLSSSTTSTGVGKVTAALKTVARKVPDGVVPIPDSMKALMDVQEEKPSAQDTKNARYSNVGDAAPLLPAVAAAESAEKPHNQANFLQNGNEVENGAHEVNENDFNIVEDRNHHDHLQEVLDDAKIVINNNNAAEEEKDERDKRNDIDLAIMSRGGAEKAKKTNEDFVNDQGFDDNNNMEEHVEEEDDDEYPNLAAQQEEGPAVRN